MNFVSFILISLVILAIGFHFSSWYNCPVCKKWIRRGCDGELVDNGSGKLWLFHDGQSHHHTPGYYHGLGGKPL